VHALAVWCFRHRRIVVIGWLVLLVGLLGVSRALGTSYDNSFSLPGADSAHALALLKANAPAQAGDSEQLVFAARGGAKLTDPAVRAQAEALLAKVSALTDVTAVISPYSPAGAGQMNAVQTVAFAILNYDKQGDSIPVAAGKTLVESARSFRSGQLDVAVEGPVAAKASGQELGGVGIGIIAAMIVLVIIFGSLLAASLPLVSTFVALPAAISVIGMLTHLIAMPDFSGQVVMLIGLGVGVDYALFIVTRMRQGLQAGQDVESAIVTAVATSGRAVLFAGAVVCIALLGLMALGVGAMTGLGVAASIGVLFTMATSLTLLPALLGFIGLKVLSRRHRRELTTSSVQPETGVWWRWSALIARRPAVPAVLALIAIGVMAVPLLSLRAGTSDAGNGAPNTTTRQAYDLLAKGFGSGFNGPLQVVALNRPADDGIVAEVRAAIGHDSGVATVSASRLLATSGDSRVVAFNVYPTTSPQDAATTDLVHRLRASVISPVVQGSGARVYIGGETATAADFARLIRTKMPLFVGLVVLLSFLLLTLLFRSILIPLTAALMNVLSMAATLGVMSAAYVWGLGGSLLGASRAGPVEAPMVVMIFAILFGLSMDYQVFLASRIQEEWRRTGDNKAAVTRGLAITGRTITAAAVIMIVVFGSFILGGERLIREFGLGLAAAVFVDAFLIRVAIVPAVMILLGRTNWWLPRRLAPVLPRVALDPQLQPQLEGMATVTEGAYWRPAAPVTGIGSMR
jgi:RND superfamily putative drug exporter